MQLWYGIPSNLKPLSNCATTNGWQDHETCVFRFELSRLGIEQHVSFAAGWHIINEKTSKQNNSSPEARQIDVPGQGGSILSTSKKQPRYQTNEGPALCPASKRTSP